MSVVRRQSIKNTVYTYIGICIGILSTVYFQPYFLSKEEVGITRLIVSLSSVISAVSCLGVTSVIVRFFPLFQGNRRDFFSIVVFFPALGFFLMCAIVWLFKEPILNFYSKNSKIISIYSIPIMMGGLFTSFASAFTAYCNSLKKSSTATLVNEIFMRVGLVLVIILYAYGILSQGYYIYSISIVFFVQLVLLFVIIRIFDQPSVSLRFFSDNKFAKEIIYFGFISSFIQIAGIGIKFVDVVMVGKYLSMSAVGIYSIAAFMGLILDTPLNAIEKIAGPKISRLLSENNHYEIEKIYKLSSKYLMMVCGLAGSVLVITARPILETIPGNYSEGFLVTIIICFGAFINAATGVNYSIITYSQYYRLGAFFYFILLMITIVLNITLIPLYGIKGAAIATALASIIHNLLRFIFIKVKFNMQPFTLDSLKISMIIIISVFVPLLINIENNYMLIFLRASIAAFIFSGLILGLKIFSIKEIKQELSVFRRV